MKFYKTSEYAIRALTYMAQNDEELISARRLHEQLDIPHKYLTMLLQKLGREGLIVSTQGAKGGYRIARPKNQIRLWDIVDIVEGEKSYDRCILGFPECPGDNPCALHKHWESRRNSIIEMLKTVTLSELAGEQTRSP